MLSSLRLPFRVSTSLARSLLSIVAIVAASVGPLLRRLTGLFDAPFLLLDLSCLMDPCLPPLFRICLPFLLPVSFPCFCAAVGCDVLVLQCGAVPDPNLPCCVAIPLPMALRWFICPRVSVRRCGWPRCSSTLDVLPHSPARAVSPCCLPLLYAFFLRMRFARYSPSRPCLSCLRHGPTCSCFLYPTSNRVYFLLLVGYFGPVGDLQFIPVCSPQRFSPSLCFTP